MRPREPRKLRASLDDSEILACPECDAPHVRAAHRRLATVKRWYCMICAARFDDPTIRERHTGTGGASGLEKQLLDLDPDAVGPEADR